MPCIWGWYVAARYSCFGGLTPSMHTDRAVMAEVVRKVGDPSTNILVQRIRIVMVRVESVEATSNNPILVSVECLKDLLEAVLVDQLRIDLEGCLLLSVP